MIPVQLRFIFKAHMPQFTYSKDQFETIAADLLAQAKKAGATASSVSVSEGFGLSVNARQGKAETIEQTRDKGIALTIHVGKRRGNASTSDFSIASLKSTVQAASDIARYTAEDDCAGLPDQAQIVGKDVALTDLSLYHPWDVSSEGALKLAVQAETAAVTFSPMIQNSDGASVSTHQGHFVSANSLGFCAGYAYSRHSLSVAPIAKLGKLMQREGWYSSVRKSVDMADPTTLGVYAAKRALSRLSARRIKTQKVPVLFEAPIAIGLMGSFVQAASGGSLYRQSSFLVDTLGKSIFADHISIEEDPFVLGGFASSVFDDEGVATKARRVVNGGTLEGYFLSSYSARKLGMTTTGNAGGSHNLQMLSAHTDAADDLPAMLKKLGTGLLVTELMGQGVNYVNGDYSRGASGYWVKNGAIQFAVEEITIAGNLKDMFKQIVAIGSDVDRRGSKCTGSVLIEQMSIAGN